MVVNCIFHLENNQNGVYYPGQIIKGQIELVLDHPKSIRSFSFFVHGIGYAHWTKRERRRRGFIEGFCYKNRTYTENVRYEGTEVYINSEVFLLGSKGGPTQEMAAGTYRFDFQCQIPPNAPSSFEAKRGYIRYYAECKMDIPWKFDKEFKLQLTVVRHEDLNLIPQLKSPMCFKILKSFGCLCCISGPFMFRVSIPHGGFASGQGIPVKIEYNNQSNVNIVSTILTLKRFIRYNSFQPQLNTKVEMEDVGGGNCKGAQKKSDVTHEITFNLPKTLPKTSQHCSKVIQISYELKVEARPSGCYESSFVVFPIVVGSTSITNASAIGQNAVEQFAGPSQMPPIEQFGNHGQMPPIGQINSSLTPTAPSFNIPIKHGYMPVPDLEPPSYEEAEKMGSQNLYAFQPTQSVGWAVQPLSAPQEKQ